LSLLSPFISAKRIARTAAAFVIGLAAVAPARAVTSYKQPGFSESAVFTGLTNPTVVRFLPDGRVLVAEKSGLLKIFPNLTTNTYTVVADLRTEVHNFWDRGLLGLAVDPNFSLNSYIYVLYSYDAAIGGTPPRWGVPGATSDGCPSPPGATTDGCVISARLSRLTATGSDWTASEAPLINDWCQQYPSHSIGSLDFGADGYLYVSGGDGASFNNSDWGQYGGTSGTPPPTPANPCGDPPFPVGTPQTKPTAEGGALRSQSPRRTAGEPRVLNGTVLRVDPATGAAAPGNPLIGSSDVNEQRIIGYGLRNPFRMIIRPGTNEVWIADVGWSTWEELNEIPDLTTARNFGWPCFEGNATQYTGLDICPAQAETTAPVLTYRHSASVVAGDGCPTGSSSVAGLAFYQGGSNYPASYENALFFSDYSRKCMWIMFPDGSGNPNPASTAAFASSAAGPVDLRIGPDGNLYYVDFDGGRLIRVKYGLDAVATANPTSGDAPLTVQFDGSGTQPAQAGDTLTYAWDLDGDGQYDDSTAQSPSFVYNTPGSYTVHLKVTDQRGASDISAPIEISAGNTPPTAFIDSPTSALTWKVGDIISFSGHATDAQDGDPMPASALTWEVIIHHCPSTCHTHVYQTFPGVAGASFPAPDHEYPSYLEIRLTATDAQGLTDVVSVDNILPQTVDLSFQTSPTGLQLTVNGSAATAPFARTVIVGSNNSVEATSPQGSFPTIWDFGSWSDSGAQNHTVTAPAAPATYTATYLTHADLGLGMSAAPEPVGAGATLAYTLNVSNTGPSQATSLSVSDTLPSGTAFVSASGTGWSCSGTGPVVCTMPSLGIAAAAPISISVTAPSAAGAIVNNASVSSAATDPVSSNNTAQITSNVFARADLSITQGGSPASVCTGQQVTYTLNVSNAGPSDAASLAVSDTIPAGATLVSASGTGWTCTGTTTVSCTRPALAVGAAPAIAVVVTAPASAGTANNSASVSSATNDPSSANNSSNASTTVNAIPTAPAASNNGPICAGGTLQLSASTVAGATYSWTGPNGFTSSLQNPAIVNATPAASGLYSVTVTVNSCTSPAGTTTATVRTLPTATVSGSAAICAGGSTQIQAALTGTGPWTVVWSDGVTQSGVAASPATRTVSPGGTTTYTVTSVSDASCAGTPSGSAVVTVNPRPTAVASGTAQVCAGDSTPLSGSGGVSCSWTPATGLSNPASCSPVAAPAATTTYTLTVTDASGCVSNNNPSVTITVKARPTATVSGTAAICAGGSTQIQAALTGTGPWTVVWSDGVTQSGVAASPATRTVSPAATTTYTVTSVSDANCSGTSSGSAVVTINPRPTAVASGTAQVCDGGSTPLSGSGGVSCSWTPATGLSDASSCSPTASPAATTTYTLTVTDASGCVSNNAPAVTVTVNSIPSPPAASNDGPACAGGTLHLSASTVAGAAYGWTGPNGFASSQQNPTIPNVPLAAAGTYSVTVTVSGCASSAATTAVAVNSPPAAVVTGSATICQGDATVISAELTGTGPWSISWSDGVVQSAGTSPATRTVSPSSTTSYTVTGLVDAHCAGTATGSADITVGAPVDTPVVTAPLWAAVGSTGLSASVPAHPGSTYAWTLTGGTIASGQGSEQISFDAGSPGTTMSLQVTETNTTCVSPAGIEKVQVDFLDVPPPHVFHDFVDTIARNGVTAGCGAGNYCPDNPNTRAQMAVFLLKSKYGSGHVPPPATGTVFADVPAGDPFAPWIEELASLGVTGGCGGGNYCPLAPVTRAQMAVFLLKTLMGAGYAPPPATGAVFQDVPLGSFAVAWIEDLFQRGITGGCSQNPPMYCPANAVTRGQMAVFLTKTFTLQ
jgi:uncharacterized repeat protein (TIGR01451 family)